MKIDLSIPGWNVEKKLCALADHAANVKENGWIVEVGTFCGRSSYTLGSNKDESVLLTSIDPFVGIENMPTQHIRGDISKIDYSEEGWWNVMHGIPNVELLRAWSPYSFCSKNLTFSKKADMILYDASHEYRCTYLSLDYWYKHLRDGGIMAIDDYCYDLFPDSARAIDDFSEKYNVSLSFVESMAFFRK